MSRVSEDSVGDKGKKGCSSKESLGKGKKCNDFWVYSGRRMENNCEGPFMAAGLGLECKI